jgi:hypothetical protein
MSAKHSFFASSGMVGCRIAGVGPSAERRHSLSRLPGAYPFSALCAPRERTGLFQPRLAALKHIKRARRLEAHPFSEARTQKRLLRKDGALPGFLGGRRTLKGWATRQNRPLKGGRRQGFSSRAALDGGCLTVLVAMSSGWKNSDLPVSFFGSISCGPNFS